MEYVDAPFFALLDQFTSLQGYFLGQVWAIGRIILMLTILFACIKHAMNGEGLRDAMTKLVIAFIVVSVVTDRNIYPKMILGMNGIVYEWSRNSLYNSAHEANISKYLERKRQEVQEIIDAGEAELEAAAEELNSGRQESVTYYNKNQYLARVKREVEARTARALERTEIEAGNIIEKELFDETRKFIKPNTLIRVLLSVAGEIINAREFNVTDPFPKILDIVCALCVILCGILGGLQYFICALEFTLITSVGVIMIPFLLWDGTKFLTEKYIGALLGFFMKMLFCTLTLLLMIYGFVSMITKNYGGTLDEFVYIIFSAIFYMMICQSGPQLAVSLLTGSPQMSLMEGAKAVGAYAAAGIAGAKAGGKLAGTAGAGAFNAAGAVTQAAGAASAVKGAGGGAGAQAGAVTASLRQSAGQTAQGAGHGLARSLVGGGKGKGGGSGAGGYNAHSQREGFLQSNADGSQKSFTEHFRQRAAAGREIGLNYMAGAKYTRSLADKEQKAHNKTWNNPKAVSKMGSSDQNKIHSF